MRTPSMLETTRDRRPLWLRLDELEDRELLRQLKWRRVRNRAFIVSAALLSLSWILGLW